VVILKNPGADHTPSEYDLGGLCFRKLRLN
jgi:hypothetical protein